MEEHFNENFIKSSTYPTAKFFGKISDFSINDLSQKNKKFSIEGELTIRKITKKIKSIAHIKMVNAHIYIQGDFQVHPADFGIKIPTVIRKKIAKEVTVFIDFEFKKK